MGWVESKSIEVNHTGNCMELNKYLVKMLQSITILHMNFSAILGNEPTLETVLDIYFVQLKTNQEKIFMEITY